MGNVATSETAYASPSRWKQSLHHVHNNHRWTSLESNATLDGVTDLSDEEPPPVDVTVPGGLLAQRPPQRPDRSLAFEGLTKELRGVVLEQFRVRCCISALSMLLLLRAAALRWCASPGSSRFLAYRMSLVADFVACLAALPVTACQIGACKNFVGVFVTILFGTLVLDLLSLPVLALATRAPSGEGLGEGAPPGLSRVGVWDWLLVGSLANQVVLLCSTWRVYKATQKRDVSMLELVCDQEQAESLDDCCSVDPANVQAEAASKEQIGSQVAYPLPATPHVVARSQGDLSEGILYPEGSWHYQDARLEEEPMEVISILYQVRDLDGTAPCGVTGCYQRAAWHNDRSTYRSVEGSAVLFFAGDSIWCLNAAGRLDGSPDYLAKDGLVALQGEPWLGRWIHSADPSRSVEVSVVSSRLSNS